MKKFFEVVLIIIILLFIFGCQKEELNNAEYNLNMNDSATDLDTRSGGHQFVFFAGSMTVTHTLLNLNPQYVFNRSLTDSVVLIKVFPEVDANVNPGTTPGRYCFLYNVIIYQRDIFPIQFAAYAPATYGSRSTIIPTGTNWNNTLSYAELQRNNNVYQEYFDLSCQIDRRNYAYRINYVSSDTSYTSQTVLTGNNGCSDLYRFKMTW